MLAKEPERFGDRHCDLTVIGDATIIDSFIDALETCFLTEDGLSSTYRVCIYDPWKIWSNFPIKFCILYK